MIVAFWMTLALASALIVTTIVRSAWRYAAVARSGADGQERVLLLDATPLTTRVVDELEARPLLGWRVVGVVQNLARQTPLSIGPWLGPLRDIRRIVDATRPTRIVLGSSGRRCREAAQMLIDARLHGVTVEHATETLEQITGKLQIEKLSSDALALSNGFRHSDFTPSDSTRVITRAISIVAAAVGLAVLWPVLLAIAVAVKLDSPGPVLFVQPRLGMRGRPFGLLKFRTMRDDTTRASEWVSDNAHRITRTGRILRRFRLDELPQLVNVLRGEMNMVGPRPHPVSNAELFLARIPHYELRYSVRPGITGWAQTRYGYANGLEEETEKMRYDLYYIKHRSLPLDARILVDTVRVLLFDRRSHERAHPPARSRQAQPWVARLHDAAQGASGR